MKHKLVFLPFLLVIGIPVVLTLCKKATPAADPVDTHPPMSPADPPLLPESASEPAWKPTNLPPAAVSGTEPAMERKQFIMIRYSDADIDRFLTLVPETRSLTSRELEVLRELLRGRKQGEVAHYLGIEVSTVKDFYKKIYTKLGVENKNSLLIKAAEVLQAE